MSEDKPLDFLAISITPGKFEAIKEYAEEHLGIAFKMSVYAGLHPAMGHIKEAVTWSKKQWLMRMGLSDIPPFTVEGLWHQEGNDIVVDLYPAEKEEQVRQVREKRREAGKKGGRPSKEKQTKSNCFTNEKQSESKSKREDSFPIKESISSPPCGDTADASPQGGNAPLTEEELAAQEAEAEAEWQAMRRALRNEGPKYNISKAILSEGAAHADAAAHLEVETEEEQAALEEEKVNMWRDIMQALDTPDA